MAFAYCPDCASRIYLGQKPWVGQPVSCNRCEADLEVTNLNPLELDWTDDLVAGDWEEDGEPLGDSTKTRQTAAGSPAVVRLLTR
jgi:lysine biosynthesis protein LysW